MATSSSVEPKSMCLSFRRWARRAAAGPCACEERCVERKGLAGRASLRRAAATISPNRRDATFFSRRGLLHRRVNVRALAPGDARAVGGLLDLARDDLGHALVEDRGDDVFGVDLLGRDDR